MKKLVFILLLHIPSIISLFAGSQNSDTSIVLFPGQKIFPSVFLDPIECQSYGGSYLLFQKDENLSLYSNVALGFTKPVLAKNGTNISWELAFGTAVFTQFDLIKTGDGVYLAGLLNSDYRLTGDFSLKKNNNILRIRLFHVSSHLGDDYMLRHNDTLPNDKSVNYEQADLTWLRVVKNGYYFAGVGEIYTKYVFRKRFSVHTGYLLDQSQEKRISLFTSGNMKFLGENNYVPDIRIAAGLSFNRNEKALLRIWAEYYTGHLPYSTLDYGRMNWTGLAMSFNIF